jgi:hypothetical protein
MQICPCAQLIKQYPMKIHGGVEVSGDLHELVALPPGTLGPGAQ